MLDRNVFDFQEAGEVFFALGFHQQLVKMR
jgi:hypothetical protein